MIYELRIYRFHKGADNKKKFRAGFAKARRFMSKYGVTFVAAWEIPTATTSSSGFAPSPTPRPATRRLKPITVAQNGLRSSIRSGR